MIQNASTDQLLYMQLNPIIHAVESYGMFQNTSRDQLLYSVESYDQATNEVES